MNRRLDDAAKQLHLTKSAVIRMLIEAFVVHCEQHGGRILIPPAFQDYKVVYHA
jgi:hypothetical protein